MECFCWIEDLEACRIGHIIGELHRHFHITQSSGQFLPAAFFEIGRWITSGMDRLFQDLASPSHPSPRL